LATIAYAIWLYLEKNPQCAIFSQGSNLARKSLYQMGIGKIYPQIKDEFDVFAFIYEHWEIFQFGKNYQAFLVKRSNQF
jgi:hypothetical protein